MTMNVRQVQLLYVSRIRVNLF